jgi:hypothetical protein
MSDGNFAHSRAVGPRGRGTGRCPPTSKSFWPGLSVNPISTRVGGQVMPTTLIFAPLPPPPDFQTFQHPCHLFIDPVTPLFFLNSLAKQGKCSRSDSFQGFYLILFFFVPLGCLKEKVYCGGREMTAATTNAQCPESTFLLLRLLSFFLL